VSLSDTSIRRPVFAIVISLVPILFGIVAILALGVREYPAVDPPIVTVSTSYTGASPEVIDSTITEPLERSINSVAGIRTMTSSSRTGQSSIRVEFDLGVDIAEAANDVRDKVAVARRLLPVDAEPPIVEKADADSSPVIFATLMSDVRDRTELSDIADTLIRDRVQTIPGVAFVRIFGERRYAMRLTLDPVAMARNDVTPAEVQQALARENVELPAGSIEGVHTEMGLRADASISNPEGFMRMVIKSVDGRPIRFEDIGRAQLGSENQRTGVKRLGVPMVGIALIPQPNSNAIAIADEYYKRIESIKTVLPADTRLEIGYDFTTVVRKSLSEVEETLLIAFGLVALIILGFLRSWRAALVPVVAIPVSIVSTFFIMYVAGFSINILTLVGLVLAIGLVCDDAIVVLENIYSKIEQGYTPLRAAVEGAREVYFAVISTTVVLAAVFIPVVFLEGLTGRLFREFGIVVAGSVLISAFVALSLSPMMCSKLLKRQTRPNWFYRVTEPFFELLTKTYAWTLRGFMKVRWVAIPITAGLGYLVIVLFGGLKQELAPLEDRANIRVSVLAPEGATYEYTEAALDRLALRLNDALPDISKTFSIVGLFGGPANTGVQNIYLTEPETRPRSQQQIFEILSKELNGVDELRTIPSQPPTIGSRFGGPPLQFVIQAPTLDRLVEILPTFLEKAGQKKELRFVDADLKLTRPEGTIEIDRERAADLGVPILEIARAIQLTFGDSRFGYFRMNGRQYQVMGQLDRPLRLTPDDLSKLHVRGREGSQIPLASLIKITEGVAPSVIPRYDRAISATVSSAPNAGYALGDGIKALREVAAEVLPEGFRTALAGEARDFEDSGSSLFFAFGLALLLAFLVLAAQFESFIDPLIVLVAVPTALAGGLWALDLTGSTLNVFSQIGLIMLIGLVTKNGILIVEFANQRKETGLSVKDAAYEAARSRFRPVLMTSLATILGVTPIAFSLGASSGSRQSLGIAVIGGLILGTFLTLYLVPALYSIISRKHRAPSQEEVAIFGAPKHPDDHSSPSGEPTPALTRNEQEPVPG
jgi:multidrug efflux pump